MDNPLKEQPLGGTGHVQLLHHPHQLIGRLEPPDLVLQAFDRAELVVEVASRVVGHLLELLQVADQIVVDDLADLLVL